MTANERLAMITRMIALYFAGHWSLADVVEVIEYQLEQLHKEVLDEQQEDH